MAKEKYYRQCKLVQVDGTTTTQVVTWIPEHGAVVGKTMRIKSIYTDKWKPGRWEVISVGTSLKSETEVKARMAAHRKYRQATDV